MAEPKEEKVKKRRIKGDAFWKLKSLERKIKEEQEALGDWEVDTAERLELYPDQINWFTGAIFDPNAEIKNSVVINAHVISRLPFDVLRDHKARGEKFKQLNKEMIEYRDKLAEQLNVWPDMIDLKTGIIADDDYDPIDPEEPEEIETEEQE